MRDLKNNTNTGLDVFHRVFEIIMPSDVNGSSSRFIKTAKQVDNGGLSATGCSNQRNSLPLWNKKTQVLDNWFTVFILEGHVFELNITDQ